MNHLVRDREVIFNLAGQVSHIDSMKDPLHRSRDQLPQPAVDSRGLPQIQSGVKVVFAGTRQVYGKPDSLPVTEDHLVRPVDVNGINKAAGENYHLLYNNVFNVRACSLRLTNVYGPRQLIKHNRQGFIGWFIRLALEGREIEIFGDGSQMRDFVYVDDAADAFLRAGASDACNGQVFNVGGSEPIAHKDLAALLIDVARRRIRPARAMAAQKKRPSTSAASTPTRRGSAARSAGSRACRCARASRRRSSSTARMRPRTSTSRRRPRPPWHDASSPLPGSSSRRGVGRGPRGDRARDRSRLVRAGARGRGIRARIRGGVAARRTPSASATAPTRSR